MKTSLTKQMMIANLVHALNVWLGEILITFENIEEAKEKIKFYLKNQKLVTIISENARKKVLNEHTYEKRFLDLFKMII